MEVGLKEKKKEKKPEKVKKVKKTKSKNESAFTRYRKTALLLKKKQFKSKQKEDQTPKIGDLIKKDDK